MRNLVPYSYWQHFKLSIDTEHRQRTFSLSQKDLLDSADLKFANCGPQTKSGRLLVFVNKVSSEHSHAHLLMYRLWLFSSYKGRVEQL